MSLTPVGDLGIALKSDVDDFQKGMRTSKESIGLFASSIRGVSAAVRNLGIIMTGVAAGAGAAMLSLSRKAERVDEAFREVGTISSQVDDVQAEYRDVVSDLNTELGLQADKLEVIEGLYQSVSAGVSEGAESQREFLTTAGKLSVVGGTELATSVDVLSTAINAYGKDTEFADRASQALFRTVQFGKTRLEELAPVMGRVMALGSDMGVVIEELGASMAVLTRTGFESRIAATGLRNVLRSMMRPSEDMQEILRDIALEQDLFSESMKEGSDVVRNLAEDYRSASEAVRKLEEAQRQARQEQEEASVAIQEARLKIQAIEEERLESLPDLTNEQVKEAESVEELQNVIEDYRFQINKARLEEERQRQELDDQEQKLEKLRKKFKEQTNASGDLQEGIGELVVESEGLVETLTMIRERADEQNIAFSDLFPRTRALQAALALVGEDADLLNSIFEDMRNSNKDAQEVMQEYSDELEDAGMGDIQNDLQSMEELFDDVTGPAQKFRNSISRIKEAFTAMGRVVKQDTFGAISNIADKFEALQNRIESMDKQTRQSISRFALLATSIGLVLGPLLLFGGQLALIASAMGTMLIPFLGITGGLLGIFANMMITASEGGEQADQMLASMQQTLAGLIGFLRRLKRLFVNEVLPGMIEAGKGIQALFSEIGSALQDEFGQSGFVLTRFANLVGEAFATVGSVLRQNKQEIAAFVVTVVSFVVNELIPAIQEAWNVFKTQFLPLLIELGKEARELSGPLMNLASAIVGVVVALANSAVLQTIVKGFLLALKVLVEVLKPVINWTAKLISTLQPVIVILVEAIAIVGTVIGVLAGLVAIGLKVVAVVGSIIAVISFLLSPLGLIVVAIGLVTAVIGGLIAGFKIADLVIQKLGETWDWLKKKFKEGVSVVVSWGKKLLKVIENSVLPTLVNKTKKQIFNLPSLIKRGLTSSLQTMKNTLLGFITGFPSLLLKQAKKIPLAIAKGINNGAKKHITTAMENVGKTIKSYLPFSPADEGPLSTNPPKEGGKNISKDIGKGIEENQGAIEQSLQGLDIDKDSVNTDLASEFKFDESNLDLESDMNLGSEMSGEGQQGNNIPAGTGQTQEINIDEKAVFFAPGSFQGVSDEELPRKVRDIVDESMDQIVEDLKGRGRGIDV